MKQEHSRIREIVKELGEKQFDNHTRPIKYTSGYDDLLEYIEQQELQEHRAEAVEKEHAELKGKEENYSFVCQSKNENETPSQTNSRIARYIELLDNLRDERYTLEADFEALCKGSE